jgi:1,4-dihydroxy-2-naphthoate octaprenyltransferase
VLSFSVGILYSAGPIPISRTTFGELFSGFFMGLIIPFLVVYISIFDQNPIGLSLDGSYIALILNWKILLPIILVSLPAMFCIANIMLANNICDVEDDLANKRYTLPIHVGRKGALVLYDALYIFSFLDILICVILGYLPLVSLLCLFTAIIVFKNIKAFHALQTKKDTFALAVKNMILIMLPLILTLLIGIIL